MKNFVFIIIVIGVLSGSAFVEEIQRYTNFPFIKKEGNRIAVDAIGARLVEQHPLDESIISGDMEQIYFEVPSLGQIPVIVPNDFKFECSDLVRLEGKYDYVDLDPSDTSTGKESYERSKIYLDKIACLNFLDPDRWYDFKIQNSYLKGKIINPFPSLQSFQVSAYKVMDEKFVLKAGEQKEFKIKLDCDADSEWVALTIQLEGAYDIFNQYHIEVYYKPEDCKVTN